MNSTSIASSAAVNLVQLVERIRSHADEITRVKGENFNVFSVLGMEHQENEVHSAFIGERFIELTAICEVSLFKEFPLSQHSRF